MVAILTTGEKVFVKSNPCFCWNPFTTSLSYIFYSHLVLLLTYGRTCFVIPSLLSVAWLKAMFYSSEKTLSRLSLLETT